MIAWLPCDKGKHPQKTLPRIMTSGLLHRVIPTEVYPEQLIHTSVGSVCSLSGLPCGVSAMMYSLGIELLRDKADLKSSTLESATS